jgi:hypothetical protein
MRSSSATPPLHFQPHVVQRVQAFYACARNNLKPLRIYFLQMTAQFLRHNPLQIQPHVVHHPVQAFCACARKNLIFAHLFLTNDCACAVPLPQSAPVPASCRPPPSTGFLCMRKEESKGFVHFFLTNVCTCAAPPPHLHSISSLMSSNECRLSAHAQGRI